MKGSHLLNRWKLSAGSSLLVMAFLFPTAVAAGDMSENMCQAYMPVLENAYSFRQQGIPINSTKDMASSAFDLDVNLYRFLIASIEAIYQNPEGAAVSLRDGSLAASCAQQVRGF